MSDIFDGYDVIQLGDKPDLPVMLNFGAGVDSTAILVKMVTEGCAF